MRRQRVIDAGSRVFTRLPELSVVVVTHNEGSMLRNTIDNFLATLPSGSELIVVDDQSSDGSTDFLRDYKSVKWVRAPARLGVARARQLGATQARGEAFVFSDAHVEVEPHWAPALCEVLANPEVGMVGPAVSDFANASCKGYGMTCTESLIPRWLPRLRREPYAVPVLCGMFLALRRDAFESSGGFDCGMLQWGSEDVELSLRLWLLGYQCVLVPSTVVAHLFRPRHPYHVDSEVVEYNRLRAGIVHLNRRRLLTFAREFQARSDYAGVRSVLYASDTRERRREMFARRLYDDDWFFGEVCARYDGVAR